MTRVATTTNKYQFQKLAKSKSRPYSQDKGIIFRDSFAKNHQKIVKDEVCEREKKTPKKEQNLKKKVFKIVDKITKDPKIFIEQVLRPTVHKLVIRKTANNEASIQLKNFKDLRRAGSLEAKKNKKHEDVFKVRQTSADRLKKSNFKIKYPSLLNNYYTRDNADISTIN